MFFRLGRDMKTKKRKLSVCFLWLIFIIMVAGIVFFSFQNGEDAKEGADKMVKSLAAYLYPERNLSPVQMITFTYQLRQGARAIGFLLIGIVGTVVIHMSCPKCNWLIKTGITAMILFAIAYFTEKFKVYIPKRHYSYDEMLISIVSVAIGFAVVSVITLAFKAFKGFFRLMTA